MLNIDYKIIIKTIANRLQRVITKLVKQKQKSFIRDRRIHDNIIEIYVVYRLYKELEVAVMLDFEKAYNRVDRN